ncbi:MAG: EAL domain-containing protein, partial [Firmicutes bacterium]|nr:EAL domain-containing protein [Bacillota bacterium]
LLRASSDFIAVEMERRRNKERLEFLSSTDSLTGVYNRERYIRELSERYQNVPARLGIIVADINGLHLLNERYGHQFGDSVIIRTASILKEILPYDVYRIAGDEFIIPCINVSKEELEADLERLRQAFAKEIDYNVSLGYSWKDGSINIDQQIQVANMMMASNKQVYYHDARQKGVLNNESFTAEILREIESGCFTVQYQPQIDLSTGTIVAAEALVRKYCKDGDLIPPGTFIPYYESRNVLMHLDIHVLDMVLADLRKLQDEGLPMVPVAVNLSRSTLLMTDFLRKVLDKFEKHGLPTSCITLEVTESISTIGREFLRDLLNEIHAAGLRLSLDDFGTQYSNTVILSDFSFDEVKFDRSLVAALHQNKRNQIILKNLINMCHEFPNTVVLAEGVETQIQADLLQKLGCDLVQGYHYYRPMSFEPFRELLQSKDPAEPAVSSTFPFTESNPPFSLLYKEGLSVKDELFSIMDVVLSTLLKSSSDMVFIKDKDLRYVNASTPFIHMLGKESSHEVIGRTDEELFDNPDLAARYTADDRRLFAGGVDLVNFTEPLPAVDGRPRYSLTSKYILRDSVGDILGILGISRDITSEYRIRQNYQHELKYMFTLSADTYAAIYIDVDAWRIINKRKQLLNNWSMPFYDSISEFAGDALRHVVDHKSEAYSYYSSLSPKTLRQIYAQGNREYVIEYQRKMPDGTVRWIRNETQFLTDPITGHLCTMWIVSDINDQKTQERHSKAVMEMDKMTGLLNRHFTEQYIRDLLEESKATPAVMSHALLVMDVDNFKALNDTKGHPAGDAFLADLGKAIKKSFRDTDIVGRVGGDEFFVFMKDVGSRENVESKVGSLFRLLQPIFNEQEVPGLSCSVGIALYGEDGSTLEDLYALADQALYHAKRTGKNRMVFAEDTK